MMNNKYSNIVIACDMDDTIEFLLKAWVRWLNRAYRCSVNHVDITDWRVDLYYPTLTKEQVFEPLDLEDFWKTVPPMFDAIKYLELLQSEGFDIYIVTSAHPESVAPKLQHVLFKYFPFIDPSKVIICHNKQLIRCDIMIDDGPHNIVGNYVGLLKDAMHNHSYNCDNVNVKRVFCWKNIYETIHSICDGERLK